ncbi:hypothetical protein JCM8547_000921 [Rhodosporidiobolus lusitaniae]
MKRRRLSPHSFLASSAALVLLLPRGVAAGDRQFTITNSCTETIWTAITNYGENSGYTGPRGFVQEAGNTTTVTIPSPWNGRIWPRRSCTFDDSGAGSCVTGDCRGKLADGMWKGGAECEDQTIGTVNVGEFNLDSWSGSDCWTIPMKIAPEGDGCDSVSCTQDVNAACPDDRMKVKDSDGNTLACIAACFAGINATEPSMNCCSGKYNDLDACVSSGVDYYDVLKPLCEHAYWYPYDSRTDYPTVDYACSADGDPGYLIEYCPDGSGTGTGTTPGSGDGSSSTVETGLASPTPATTSDEGGSSKTGGTAATGSGSSKTSSAASSDSTGSSSSSSSSSSDEDTSSSSSSSSTHTTILGLSRPVFFGLAAAIVLALVLSLFFVVRRKSTSAAPAPVTATGGRGQETTSDDTDTNDSSSGDSSGSDGEGDSDEEEEKGRRANSLAIPTRRTREQARLLSGT